MSRIHIQELLRVPTPPGQDIYRGFVHTAAPTGNNSAGVPWADAFIGAERAGFTRMTEGNGFGEIPTAEKIQVEMGNLIELEMEIAIDRITGEIVLDRDGFFDSTVAALITALQEGLDRYGRVEI